jgi:Mn-containing catalase
MTCKNRFSCVNLFAVALLSFANDFASSSSSVDSFETNFYVYPINTVEATTTTKTPPINIPTTAKYAKGNQNRRINNKESSHSDHSNIVSEPHSPKSGSSNQLMFSMPSNSDASSPPHSASKSSKSSKLQFELDHSGKDE